ATPIPASSVFPPEKEGPFSTNLGLRRRSRWSKMSAAANKNEGETAASTPRAATSFSVTRSARNARQAEVSYPLEKLPVDDSRLASLALPCGAAEALAPRGHGDAPAGELVDLFPDLRADILGQRRRRIVEARHHVIGRRRTVVEEAAPLVPDQRPITRVDSVEIGRA